MLHMLHLPTIKVWKTMGATLACYAQRTLSLQDTFTAFIVVSGKWIPWKLQFMERHGLTSRIWNILWSGPPPILIATSIGGNNMSSLALCLRHFLCCDLPITTRPSWKIYTIISTSIPSRIKKNADDINNPILFPPPEEDNRQKWVWHPGLFHRWVQRQWGCCPWRRLRWFWWL